MIISFIWENTQSVKPEAESKDLILTCCGFFFLFFFVLQVGTLWSSWLSVSAAPGQTH